MPTADLAPLGSQQASQHPRTGERELHMQPVETPHDREIGVRHRARQVIDAAATDLQNLRLLRDRQIVLAVDHRFALNSPALVSAPSKKSFSSVNSPILAWRVLTSTVDVAASALASLPKTPTAPSSNWLFHCVIWLACTSNCCASSASVFSPLRAARATFALKAGVWFRRVRFPMCSPDVR